MLQCLFIGDMWVHILLGLSTGLSAGISPGPLLVLVIAASLRSGVAGGVRVALAPLITDAPIILVTVLVVRNLPPGALRWVGTAGGMVVIWMGLETLRSARREYVSHPVPVEGQLRQEMWRGVVVNALNPHPYVFWATIGGPALVNGWRTSPWYALAFLLPFYLLLVGSKAILAWLVSRKAQALTAIWYRRVLIVCGALVLAMGGFLLWQTWAG
jgi:threonine/homoserine/homoserine lactone efflux protein